MATSTYKTFLMKKASGSGATYEKLIDVSEVPDLGSAPELLETTTLSDPNKTYIPGLQDPGSLQFVANYTPEDYDKLYQLRDQDLDLAVYLGGTESTTSGTLTLTPTGSEGKFTFKGRITVFLASQATNAVRKMNINIATSTAIAFSKT